MESRQVKSIEDAIKIVQARNLSHVKVGIFDIDGIMRGKYMKKEKFFSALEKGFGFCDVILGWDANDQLYDNINYTGWHTGYPDANLHIIPESCRELALENGLFFLAEFAGKASEICPRGVLKRVLQRYDEAGLVPLVGFEYEFFLFNESAQSIRKKHYQNLETISPGFFGYSVLRNSVDSPIYEEILALTETMDFALEGLHAETGPGVIEAALVADSSIAAADKAALFKTFCKVWAQKKQMLATFMAKWNDDWPGQSGHIHISVGDKSGKNLFYDAQQAHDMSEMMHHFVAGQQLLMPQFQAMIAPTINSYRRLVPGFWAPTTATWGVDNRTCALRVIQGETAQRVEYRIGAADANPYIILAAALASGLWGIKNKRQPSQPVKGNAYECKVSDKLILAPTLEQSIDLLRQSEAADDYFGSAFVEHFCATRAWEVSEFRKHISQWELERYFEII